MIDVDAALSLILERCSATEPAELPVSEAIGRVLAEQVSSDVDSPPHDKSMVDGYAVLASDLNDGRADLAVIERITAGEVPTRPVTSGCATQIMTGAPIPEGADAVVMVERTRPAAGDSTARIVIDDSRLVTGQNIMLQASSLRRGQCVLDAGSVIRPIEVGMLSEVGRTHVLAHRAARVAILPTGDELVSVSAQPKPGQIRNSNGPMLAAQVSRCGAVPVELGIAPDDENSLRESISRGLEADLLVLSGGVSAGVMDLVPGVLAKLGVTQVFHKVRLKPGKPLWFGSVSSRGRERLVFGLPGNPVSSMVCFELFVRPAIERMSGHRSVGLSRRIAQLAGDFRHRGDRETYHPAVLRADGDLPTVETIQWQGSADLASLSSANSLACFPPGEQSFSAGDTVEVLLL